MDLFSSQLLQSSPSPSQPRQQVPPSDRQLQHPMQEQGRRSGLCCNLNSDMECASEQSRTPSSSSNPIEERAVVDGNVSMSSSSKDLRRSNIWKHFERKKVNNIWKAECNDCHKLLGGVPKNGTTHLHEHRKRCPALGERGVRRHIVTKEALKGYTPFNQDEGRRATIDMIILHDYPLAMVDHVGFRKLLNVLQPQFRCPTRNTIKSDILKMYGVEKKKVMELFENCDSRIAVTSDMWTASNQMRGYMVITAHFIDSSWSIQSRILRFVYVPCPHTSEVLCEVLMNSLIDWNIDTKLSSITLDNCSTNDKMIDLVKEKIHSSSMILGGQFLHMRCCAHILNLIVKDGMIIIKDAIDSIRNSVSYWTATPSRKERFEEAARQLKIPLSKTLSLDCQTRWNSTYLMLQTALNYRDIFYRLRQRDPKYTMLPSDSDWKFCAEVCDKLKIFYKVTELFSGSTYPTANLYFPNICFIRIALDNWQKSPNELIAGMAKTMMGKFAKYWDEMHVLMGVSAVLDPRYKMEILNFFFPKIYGDKASCHTEKIRDACVNLFNEYKARNEIHRELDNEVDLLSSPLVFSQSQEVDDDLFIFDAYVKRQKRTDPNIVKTELDKYLEAGVLARKSDFDILTWWMVNGDLYPTLKQIARYLLAIQVSTVASESAFSISGRIIDPHRSRLQPTTVEALMCVQSWLGVSKENDGDTLGSTLYGTNDICTEEEAEVMTSEEQDALTC